MNEPTDTDTDTAGVIPGGILGVGRDGRRAP